MKIDPRPKAHQERNALVYSIIEEFVFLLRRMPSEIANREKMVHDMVSIYKQKLIAIEATPEEVERFSEFRYICFEADRQSIFPTNHNELSTVITNHAVLEWYLKRYIRRRYPVFPWTYADKKKWGFAVYLDIWLETEIKEPLPKAMYNGIKEVNGIRNRYAHSLNYQLSSQHMNKIKAYFAHTCPYQTNHDSELEMLTDFCIQACSYLQGLFWEVSNWVWDFTVQDEPNWDSFAKKYGSDTLSK